MSSNAYNSGDLDRQVTLQAPAHTTTGTGARVQGWATVGTVWARRLSAKGREFHGAGVDLAVVEEAFQVRHASALAGIDATWRLLFEGAVYDITHADFLGRNERITLWCKKGGNRG